MDKLNKFDLSGKTALITGGGGLLGVQHAYAILEANGNVVLTDISSSLLENAKSKLFETGKFTRIQTYLMDVTKQESIQSVFDSLTENGNRIDILINNAAIDPKVKGDAGILESSRIENFPLEQWNLQMAVGLTGAFLCSKLFGTAMASDGKGGIILNIASDLSVISPDQRLYKKHGLADNCQPVKPVTYSVIKAGLAGLTRYLATYWPNKGVRSNTLSPGGIYNGQNDEFVTNLTSLIPLGRMARIDEYHGIIQFLCSDASAYLNGQNIVMDGGRSIW